jgi:putative PIN family toxin of toxin-antitoxin system
LRIAVIDTNVIASALLTANDDAPTARILDGIRLGRVPIAISGALLVEYHEVLRRPKLRKRHGLNEAEIESLLMALVRNAVVLDPVAGPAAPDPGDQHLWDLMASHDQLCLVTGDQLLLKQHPDSMLVWSPAEFLQYAPDAAKRRPSPQSAA